MLSRHSKDSRLHYADMGGVDDKIKITSADGKLRVEIDSVSFCFEGVHILSPDNC